MKLILALAAVSPLATLAAAQESALLQLSAAAGHVQVQAVPLPDRAASWSEDAPFSPYQKPAEIISRGRSVIKVGNVRWGALPADGKSYRWETASVFPELLDKVYYGLRTAGTGHSLLVFVFKDGGFTNSSGERSAALTIGAEPYTRAPENYVRSNDLLGRYPLVWNLTTLANYADFNVNVYGSSVQLSPVNIPREDAIRLLNAALDKAGASSRLPETHIIFSNNCTTSAVKLLDQVLPGDKRIPEKKFMMTNPDAAAPHRAVASFTRLGALSGNTILLDRSNYRAAETLAAE